MRTELTSNKRNVFERQGHNEHAHLSRVTMLNELSGFLAHELTQPLAAICSNAQAALQLLAQKPSDIQEVRDILEDIIADDRRASEIIRSFRLLCKKGETRHVPLDLNEIVNDVLRLARRTMMNPDIDCIAVLAPDLPRIIGDRVQVQQVLLNLVINGCEAMLDMADAERQLLVTANKSVGGFVEVCVIDNGYGIKAGDLDQIFDPFFTTKTEGLGLGLSICQRIIAAHGGRLWATNNVGHGTILHFTIPAES